jgi:prevent-host-death family protein
MKSVKIAELKDNLSRYLRAAEKGASVVVTDRDRPVARIVPILAEESVEVVPASRPFSSVRARRFAPTRATIDSLALLLEERADRS